MSLRNTLRKSRNIRSPAADAFWYGRAATLRDQNIQQARAAKHETLRRAHVIAARHFNQMAVNALVLLRAKGGVAE